jgi:hypothetical protein
MKIEQWTKRERLLLVLCITVVPILIAFSISIMRIIEKAIATKPLSVRQTAVAVWNPSGKAGLVYRTKTWYSK